MVSAHFGCKWSPVQIQSLRPSEGCGTTREADGAAAFVFPGFRESHHRLNKPTSESLGDRAGEGGACVARRGRGQAVGPERAAAAYPGPSDEGRERAAVDGPSPTSAVQSSIGQPAPRHCGGTGPSPGNKPPPPPPPPTAPAPWLRGVRTLRGKGRPAACAASARG